MEPPVPPSPMMMWFSLKFITDNFVAEINKLGKQDKLFLNCPKKLFPFWHLIRHLNTVKLIDVLWFQKGANNVIAAFEVKKSTSIYSGILRLTDLAYSIADGDEIFYLIVPDNREKMLYCNYLVLQLSK